MNDSSEEVFFALAGDGPLGLTDGARSCILSPAYRAAVLGWWVAYCHLKVRSYTFFDNVTYDSDPGYRDFVR